MSIYGRWQVLPWSKFIRTPGSQRQRYQKATLAWKSRSLNDAFLPPIPHLLNDYRLSRSLKMLLRLECLGWNSRSNLTDMRPGENGTTASRVPTTVSFCLSRPAPFCFYGPLCFCSVDRFTLSKSLRLLSGGPYSPKVFIVCAYHRYTEWGFVT